MPTYNSAEAEVTVVPSFRGFSAKVSTGVKGTRAPNVKVGVEVDRKALHDAERAVEDASDRVAKSRDKEATAAERVRIAEARLTETRKSAEAGSAKLIQSETRLAQAKRDNVSASRAASKAAIEEESANSRLLAAQARLAKSSAGGRNRASFTATVEKVRIDVDDSGLIRGTRNALKLTLALYAVAAASLAVSGGVQVVAALTVALVAASGAAALLPAALAGGIAVFAALKIGMTGVADAIKSGDLAGLAPQAAATVTAIRGLRDEYDGLKGSVQNALFTDLGSSLERLAAAQLPGVTRGLTGIATGLNEAAKNAGLFLGSTKGVADVNTILGNTSSATGILANVSAPLVRIFTDFAAVGSTFLPQLAQGFFDSAINAGAFVANARETGQLAGWISGGLAALSQFGTLLGNLISIIGSVWHAANSEGATTLQTIVDLTTRLREFLASVEGQTLLQTFFSTLRQVIENLRPGVEAIGTALRTAFLAVAPALPGVAAAFSAVAIALAPFVDLAGWLIGVVLPPLASMLEFLAPVLGVLAAVIIAVVVALKTYQIVMTIVSAVTAIWNAILLANPIGLVILAIIALIAGIVYCYTQFEWFRNAVQAVWSFLQSLAGWIAGAFVAAWQWLGTAVSAVGSGISAAVSAMGTAISWIYNSVILPVINFFAAAGLWLWNNILAPAFSGIGAGFSALGTGLKWVYDNIIVPVFDFFRGTVEGFKSTFQSVVDGIIWIWRTLENGFKDPVRFVIQTVWNEGIGGFWKSAKEWIPILPEWKDAPLPFASGGVIPGYQPGVDTVPAMLSRGEAIMRPEWTRAVGEDYVNQLNSVARRGPGAVRSFMNYGGERLAQFADGGVVDRAKDWASGEAGKPYIWAGVGPRGYDCSGFMSAITNFLTGTPLHNRRFSTGAFGPNRGTGGFIPGLSSAFSIGVNPNTGDGIGHMAGTLGGMNVESRGGDGVVVGGGARGADNSLFPWQFSLPQVGGQFASGGNGGDGGGGWLSWFQPAFDLLKNSVTGLVKTAFPGDGNFLSDIPLGLTTKVLDGVEKFIFGEGNKISDSGSSAGGGSGQWAGVVNQALSLLGLPLSLAGTTLRRMTKESGGNPRAINNWDSNARKGTPSKGLMQVIDPTFRQYRDVRTPNDVWDPLANVVASMRYALGRYGSLPAAYDRTGGYDSGGWLMPGDTLAQNNSGVPEAILTGRQWKSVESLAARGASGGGSSPAVMIGQATFVDPVDVDTLMARAEFASKGASF